MCNYCIAARPLIFTVISLTNKMFYREACEAQDNRLSQSVVCGNQTDQAGIIRTTKGIDHKVYWSHLYCCPFLFLIIMTAIIPYCSHTDAWVCGVIPVIIMIPILHPINPLKAGRSCSAAIRQASCHFYQQWAATAVTSLAHSPPLPITAFSLPPPPLYFHLFFPLKAS